MRILTLPRVLLLAAAGAYALHRARKSTPVRATARSARGTVPPPDPMDPVQAFYSEHSDMLERDESEDLDAAEEVQHDTGDLYGVHVSRAEDTSNPDNDVAMELGNNWIEALSISATEGGTLPEHEFDIDEDAEILRGGHSTDTKDTPVADRGAGGPAGL
ncbi:hypothetical protein BH11MYX2_BH11MYX2_22040 [soil metagenome]